MQVHTTIYVGSKHSQKYSVSKYAFQLNIQNLNYNLADEAIFPNHKHIYIPVDILQCFKQNEFAVMVFHKGAHGILKFIMGWKN